MADVTIGGLSAAAAAALTNLIEIEEVSPSASKKISGTQLLALMQANLSFQPLDSDLTAIAALTTTAYGRSLLAAANAAGLRTLANLVIGTDVQAPATTLAGYGITDAASDSELAAHEGDTTNVHGIVDTSALLTSAAAAAAYQPLDSDLTAIAALTTTSYGRAFLALADAAALQSAGGLVIGTNVQAYDADLATIAGLTATTDNFIVSVASAWASRTPAQVRSTLALVPGTNVQAWDADLDAIAALADPNADRLLFWDDSAGAYAYLTAGTGLTITGTTLDASGGGSGTVTSVDLTVPGLLFSVSGNPVTTAGTLALSLLTQTANTILAGPASGGAATPTMRSLVAADIPAISLTAGVSGILPSANGGTGVNNAGTITNATNTTITGGGTLALGGFTLTVPATGSAALLGTSNLFTVRQDIRASGSGLAAGLYVPWITGDALPIVRVGNQTTGNNQIGLYVESRTERAIYAETTSGTAAIVATTSGSSNAGLSANGPTGVSAIGGANYGINATATSGIGVSGASNTGVPIYGVRNGSLTSSAGTLLRLDMASSATPVAGFGGTIDFNLKSSTTPTQPAAQISAEWVVATHASRTARVKLNVYDTATREVLRGEASGSAPLIGFLGAAAVGIQTLGAAASDAATTQTLANNIRQALINLGLGQT